MTAQQPEPHRPWAPPQDHPEPTAAGGSYGPPRAAPAPAAYPYGAPTPYAAQTPYGAPTPYGTQTPYGQGPPHAYTTPARFRSNAGLSTALLVLGGVWTGIQLISSILAIQAQSRYAEADLNGEDPASIFTAYDVVSVFLFPVMLAVWIVGSLWLSTAYENARAIAPENLGRKKLWVWLGWWVPVVSWWFPKTIVDDVWFTTASQTRSVAPKKATGQWWAAWVVSLVISNVMFRSGLGDGSVTTGLVAMEWALTLTTVIGFALWVPVVRGVTATQTALVADPPQPNATDPRWTGWGAPGSSTPA